MYGLPIRRLDLLQNDHTPRTDCIVARPPGSRRTRDLAAPFGTRSDQWDVLQLSQLPDDSRTARTVAALARPRWLPDRHLARRRVTVSDADRHLGQLSRIAEREVPIEPAESA